MPVLVICKFQEARSGQASISSIINSTRIFTCHRNQNWSSNCLKGHVIVGPSLVKDYIWKLSLIYWPRCLRDIIARVWCWQTASLRWTEDIRECFCYKLSKPTKAQCSSRLNTHSCSWKDITNHSFASFPCRICEKCVSMKNRNKIRTYLSQLAKCEEYDRIHHHTCEKCVLWILHGCLIPCNVPAADFIPWR